MLYGGEKALSLGSSGAEQRLSNNYYNVILFKLVGF